jgi:exopolyphosphatase/guanosine-5'-triphosphate,3'-diphosphate pyrophosphatase
MGTNVFGLIIGTVNPNGQVHWIHRAEIEAGLALEGFGTLNEAAQKRATNALHQHFQTAVANDVAAFYGFGTAALRQWSEASVWLRQTASGLLAAFPSEQQIPCQLTIVTGEQEAEWIRFGLQETGLLEGGPVLVNDIGGGSVELVLCHGRLTYLSLSLPLGMRKLLQQFPADKPTEDCQNYSRNSLRKFYRQAYLKCYEYLLVQFKRALSETLRTVQPLRILGTAGPYSTLDQWVRAYTLTENDSQILISRAMCAAFGNAATLNLTEPYPPMHPLKTDAVIHAAALMLALSDAAGGLPICTTELSMREGALLALFHHRTFISPWVERG